MFSRILKRLIIFLNLFKFRNINHGFNFMVLGKVDLILGKRSKITIGNNFALLSGSMHNSIGRNMQSCIRVDDDAEIEIGNNVGMSNVSIWSKMSIKIGDNVKLGADTIILDSDMHSLDYLERRVVKTDSVNAKKSPIVIGDDVFIGARSIITKGVSIGNQSIIAAGSIVSRSIPEKEIWGGNPVVFIKKI